MRFLYNENTAKQSDNIMDKWIQSFTQSLIQFFKAEMDGETSARRHTDVFFDLLKSGLSCTRGSQCQCDYLLNKGYKNTLTVIRFYSLPPLHCRASPGKVCGHANQLVRQDQQTPSEGEKYGNHQEE